MKPANQERLDFLLNTLEKEQRHLLQTTQRLSEHEIDSAWVESLEQNPDLAERLDAFVARFARMQDTLGDKLIPELMRHMLETPGSALDNLNRMEALGLLASVDDWVEARNLRNRLVHEYMDDPVEFAMALNRAMELVVLLSDTWQRLQGWLTRYTDSR